MQDKPTDHVMQLPGGEFPCCLQPEGFDISRSSFSLSFWLQANSGGCPDWTYKEDLPAVGTGIRLEQSRFGGVICGNTGADAGSGFLLALLPRKVYGCFGVRDRLGHSYSIENLRILQDTRWHHIVMTADREKQLSVYVDTVLAGSLDISFLSGDVLGENRISFGADLLGKRPLYNTRLEDIFISSRLLSQEEREEQYYSGYIKRTCRHAEKLLETVGPEYSEPSRDALRGALRKAKAESDSRCAAALLDGAYEAFIRSPEPKALLRAALISDTHYSPEDDTGELLERLLSDLTAAEVKPQLLIHAGDLANHADAEAIRASLRRIQSAARQQSLPYLACLGNHDYMFEDGEARFAGSMTAFQEIMTEVLSADDQGSPAPVLDEWYPAAAPSYLGADAPHAGGSYAVTVRDFHFLVINRDETEDCLDKDRSHGMGLLKGTYEWIRHILSRYSRDGKRIFVICHYPFRSSVPYLSYRQGQEMNVSLGEDDEPLRSLFSSFRVTYLCGHVHFGPGFAGSRVSADRSLVEIVIPSARKNLTAYTAAPVMQYLFCYEQEMVLRSRDCASGSWLSAYDEIIPYPTQRDTTKPGRIPFW